MFMICCVKMFLYIGYETSCTYVHRCLLSYNIIAVQDSQVYLYSVNESIHVYSRIGWFINVGCKHVKYVINL